MQSPIRTRLVASAFAVGMLVTGAAGTGMTANAAMVTLPAATSVATPGTQPAITATTFDLSKQTQVGFYGAADGNVKEGLSDSKTIAVTPGEYTVTYTAVKGSDKGVANGEFSATPHVFPASGKVDTSGDGTIKLSVRSANDTSELNKDVPTSQKITVTQGSYGFFTGDKTGTAGAGKVTLTPVKTTPDKPDTGLKGDANKDGKYTAADLTGATATNTTTKKQVTGFDPTRDKAIYRLDKNDKAGSIIVANLPEGWSVTYTPAMSVLSRTATVTSPDGKTTVTYTFTTVQDTKPTGKTGDANGDGKYTLADLDDVTINADGKAVWRDGKPTGTPVSKTSRIVVDNTPGGWTAKASLGAKALTVTFTAPDKTPVTVTIDYKATIIDIDLSKVSDAANPGFGTLGIVSVTDPADTPKPVNPTGNRQPHTVADQYQGITPGEYQITYTAVNDEDATKRQQPTVNGTWYSASTTTNGIFGSATGSTSHPITVAADWYKPADGKQTPTSVNVDMPAGSFMNLEGGPKAGILHLTRVGDLPQADKPADKDGQTAPIRPIVDASRPGDSLPHTGAGALMPAVMGILFGLLGMIGVRMRRHA